MFWEELFMGEGKKKDDFHDERIAVCGVDTNDHFL